MPAAQVFADDMQNAEEIFRKSSRKKPDRHVQQLCRQVERTLSIVLAGEVADPILQNLSIESVTPAPDAGRLLVRVYEPGRGIPAPEPASTGADLNDDEHRRARAKATSSSHADILERLARVRGLLRREVAAAITRKRAPELIFQLVIPGEVRP
jgi:ribosome-binding factor A